MKYLLLPIGYFILLILVMLEWLFKFLWHFKCPRFVELLDGKDRTPPIVYWISWKSFID